MSVQTSLNITAQIIGDTTAQTAQKSHSKLYSNQPDLNVLEIGKPIGLNPIVHIAFVRSSQVRVVYAEAPKEADSPLRLNKWIDHS